jgi:hypothetical protein
MNSKNILFGILLSFFGSLTFGNAPYAITGYGLSTFCLLVIAYCFSPTEAYISFIIGNTLGLGLNVYTESMFFLVIVGAGVFRIVQVVVLIELKKRYDLIASSLASIITLAISATLIGMFFYGGEGLMTAMTILDVIYILPAYMIMRLQKMEIPNTQKIVGYSATLSSTIFIFLSASTFFLPIPFMISIILLTAVIIFIRKPDLVKIDLKSSYSSLISCVIVVIFLISFFISGPAYQYALKTTLYPMDPNSLTGNQWTQTNSASECRQGNLAGEGTEENGVWSVERLRVIDTCKTLTGKIDVIHNVTGLSVDNDFTFDVKPDPEYAYLLSFGSYAIQGGTIHIEVVPSDQNTVLAGLSLKAGDHVRITGVWLLDTNHGWFSEIHPAWNIAVIP